jgi:RNA polymerase primary sigma factor
MSNIPEKTTEEPTYHAYINYADNKEPLTTEQECALARRIAQGDDKAKAQLVEANLGLVIFIARRYNHPTYTFKEIIADGNIGLLKASEKFNPELGHKFSTYAVHWIKMHIRKGLQNHNKTIYIPIQVSRRLSACKHIKEQLENSLGRVPTNVEIRKELKLTESQFSRVQSADIGTTSIHAPTGSESDGYTLEDTIQDEETVSPAEACQSQVIKELLNRHAEIINPKEFAVLTYRFGLYDYEPKTLDDISQILDITRERVRQIQNAAFEKLMLAVKQDPETQNILKNLTNL